MLEDATGLATVEKLGAKDIKLANADLTSQEARYLVDTYYMMQDDRKRAANQVRALSESEEPHLVLDWLLNQSKTLENQIKLALDVYSDNHPVGAWSRSIKGIGPVIAAGLLAHIDIEKAPTAGHIWAYAGLDPTKTWGKGQKRPWNAELKTLCWKIGESFVKVSGKEDSFYGKVYRDRKALEVERNEAGQFKAQAENILATRKIGKDTGAYKAYIEGKLPPAHIQARAKRYAVKLFLAHWHHVAYVEHFKKEPPAPYPIAILGHAHYIAPSEAS